MVMADNGSQRPPAKQVAWIVCKSISPSPAKGRKDISTSMLLRCGCHRVHGTRSEYNQISFSIHSEPIMQDAIFLPPSYDLKLPLLLSIHRKN